MSRWSRPAAPRPCLWRRWRSTERRVEGPQPPREPLTVITTGYLPHNATRANELSQVLRRNLRNPYITSIHVFTQNCTAEAGPTSITHPKLTRECVGQQPEYLHLFQYANENLFRQLVVITNSDISFTDSLRHVALELPSSKKRVGMILSRWAFNCPEPDGLAVSEFEHRCWANFKSYDSFVYRPKIPRAVYLNMTYVMNRMAAEHMTARLLKRYLDLGNPCLDIVTMHNHCSSIREWKSGTKENDYLSSFSGKTLRFLTRNLKNVSDAELRSF